MTTETLALIEAKEPPAMLRKTPNFFVPIARTSSKYPAIPLYTSV
jgi:hypothetical protein